MSPIPITVFTGFLGAGKTSIILSLLPQLPKDYKVVLLKNEFGDIEVDSKLAQQSSLTAVSEILNGCMCCVLVGQMQTALLEIREKFRPDRIIIECSGSAFPATLAFQIRQLERETEGDLKLDAMVTVIDAENFRGYEDTSPTARMQASYSDIILINKWEHISERQLDILFDHINTLNDQTAKIKCKEGTKVDPNLIFGLESTLFLDNTGRDDLRDSHNEEVETVKVVYRSGSKKESQVPGNRECSGTVVAPEAEDVEEVKLERATLVSALASLQKETVWRVKGFVRLRGEGTQIVNWAFGRVELTPAADSANVSGGGTRLTVMGERGEVKRAIREFCTILHLSGTIE